MADEKTRKDGAQELVQPGRQYEEVGPDLGRLYEARHAVSGRSCLLLLPGERVHWQPEGVWRVVLSCQPDPPSVSLEIEQAPVSVSMPELTDVFVLMTAALKRVEDNPQLHDHFAAGIAPPPDHLRPTGRQAVRTGSLPALVALSVLVLVGLWLRFTGRSAHPAERSLQTVSSARPEDSEVEFWSVDTGVELVAAAPDKVPQPRRNQKRAPCVAGLELEISGVCWISVTQRPCPRQTIAYEGNCLLPVAKPPAEPTSVDAGAPQ